MDNTQIRWEYDSDTGLYYRFQDGGPHNTENSGQVTHQAALLVHRRGERVGLAVLTDEAPWGGGGFEAIEGVARRLLSSPPPHRGGWPVP